MASSNELGRAKERLLDAAVNASWLVGVGIGRVDGEVGLVVSVEPRSEPEARRVLDELDLGVPVLLRGIGDVRARDEPASG